VSGRERWIFAVAGLTWGLVSYAVVATFDWSPATVTTVLVAGVVSLAVCALAMDPPRTWQRFLWGSRTGKPVGWRWVPPAIVGVIGLVYLAQDWWTGVFWVAWAIVMLTSMIYTSRRPTVTPF
jgi:hypothetical protein